MFDDNAQVFDVNLDHFVERKLGLTENNGARPPATFLAGSTRRHPTTSKPTSSTPTATTRGTAIFPLATAFPRIEI